jgi:hypothetical protein
LRTGLKTLQVREPDPDDQRKVAPSADRIRAMVRMLDLSISKVATLAGISRNAASRFMRGDPVTLETMIRIESAVALHMKLMEQPRGDSKRLTQFAPGPNTSMSAAAD